MMCVASRMVVLFECAYMGMWDNDIQVKEVKGHTCTLDLIDARHQNISADFVASHMYPHNALKAIIGATEEKFGYTISYGKAYQAKKKVLEHRWGTYEASYHKLPNLLPTIVQMNPGSYYDINVTPVFPKKTKCKPICMPGSSFMHIADISE
jgi:hypothetical protein